jgi:DNA repair protein RadD
MADLFDALMAEEVAPIAPPPPTRRPPPQITDVPTDDEPSESEKAPSGQISGPSGDFNNPRLRPYQQDLIRRFWGEVDGGKRKVLMVLPTGGGKTVVCSEIIDQALQKGLRVLFLAHRRELISQASKTFHAAHLDHGIIQAGFSPRLWEKLQVASIATVHARAIRSSAIELPEFDLIVIDECFPAGTPIDAKPIEAIREGDSVRSFNHETGQIEVRRVVRLFKSRPSGLVTVHLRDGRAVTCTPGHPFYTAAGYIPAASLNGCSMVLSSVDEKKISDVAMFPMRHSHDLRRAARAGVGAEGASLLLGRVSKDGWPIEIGKDPGANKSAACFGSDEGKQSDDAGWGSGESIGCFASDRARAAVPRGERHRNDQAGGCAFGGHGSSPIDCLPGPRAREWIPDALQDRLGARGDEVCGRGRWVEPQGTVSARAGSAQGRTSEWVGVDRVEVHECGSDGRYGGLCPDGFVYNFEVEGNHNYFAGDVLVHNCHRSTAKSYQDVIKAYPQAILLGLTATPCRGDGRGLGECFDVLLEGARVGELVEGGFLVPTRVFAPFIPDLEGVKVVRGDYAENQLAEKMDKQSLIGDVVLHWIRLAEGRKTVVFATSVAHSMHLAQEFQRQGILAEHVDGTTPAEERDRINQRVINGEIDVLCNCAVYTEGWDLPEISCVILARPTKSIGLFRQMIGRALRPSPGKENCLILDHAGAVFEHGFIDEDVEWSLKESHRAKNGKAEARKQRQAARLVACPECASVNWQGRPCSACGWRPRPKASPVAMGDGDLGEVIGQGKTKKAKKAAIKWDMQQFYGMLKSVGESRGYKPGWAYWKFREKFPAAKPGRDWPAVAPSAELLAWVRSRQIARAKGMAR